MGEGESWVEETGRMKKGGREKWEVLGVLIITCSKVCPGKARSAGSLQNYRRERATGVDQWPGRHEPTAVFRGRLWRRVIIRWKTVGEGADKQ